MPNPNDTSLSRAPYPKERQEVYNNASQKATTPVYSRTIPPPRNAGHVGQKDGGMSFVMLGESQIVPASMASGEANENETPYRSDSRGQSNEEQGFSAQVERSNRLFEIISARSDIDHPICAECTQLVIDELTKKLHTVTKERDAYITFMKSLNNAVPTDEEVKAADEELKKALKDEAVAFEELEKLEKESAALDVELAALEDEAAAVDKDEEEFWQERNAFALELNEIQNERDSLNMKYAHDARQLERLQRTNVYNDAFCIGHDGYFGTINGLRLGRRSHPTVEWSEINAAWGQALLLLSTVAEKLGYEFQGYVLHPMGSSSFIDKIESNTPSNLITISSGQQDRSQLKTTHYDLHFSGDLLANLPFMHRSFDNGMVAFLDCLSQLGTFVERTSSTRSTNRGGSSGRARPVATGPGLRMPYEISRDKINGTSIRFGFNQNDEAWSKACKYTLTCCKFLLAHASNVAKPGPAVKAAASRAKEIIESKGPSQGSK